MALQSMTAIANITLQSTSSEVVFSSIPAVYRDLVIVIAGTTTTTDNIRLRFNSDTASNFSSVRMWGDGSSPGSDTTAGNFISLDSRGFFSTGQGVITAQVFDYAQNNKHKTVLSRANNAGNGVGAQAGRWASTTAVHTVSIFPFATTFAIGSTFSLYGRIA